MNPINWTALISLVITVSLFGPYINWLKGKQIEQFLREEGPQSHAAKAKTPTMGGLCFSLVAVFVSLAYILIIHVPDRPNMLPLPLGTASFEPPAQIFNLSSWPLARASAIAVVTMALFCGLIGFADDYGKITSRSNKGLPAKLRLALEFALGLLLSAALWLAHGPTTELLGPGGWIHLNTTWQLIYMLGIVPLMVASTTNAINLHDGMDGLAGGTSALVFSTLFFMLTVIGQVYLAMISAAMLGAVTGFLVFNRYPAKVFMGDTGSLFIGGMMAGLVTAGGLVLWFIPLALLYIAEAASVIAQVVYFKLTKPYQPETAMSGPALAWLKLTRRLPGEGKRLFRMAPLHHHFEALGEEHGEPEWKVVAYFWVFQFMLCAFTWLMFTMAYSLP